MVPERLVQPLGPGPRGLKEFPFELARIDEGRGTSGVNPRYLVDRLREQSWVLEPQETTDPYRDSKAVSRP